MKKLHTDYLIIGGGPAGLGVAKSLLNKGEDFLLIDGNSHLGGSINFILDEKLVKYGDYRTALRGNLEEILTTINEIENSKNVILETWGIEIHDNEVLAVSKSEGVLGIKFDRAIIATGSRDATKWEMLIVGNNVYGVLTTRMALRLLLKGVIFGKEIVVYGSRPLTRFLVTILEGLEKENKLNLKMVIDDPENRFYSSNVVVGKVIETFGIKKLNSVRIQTEEGELFVDCDSLVIGVKGKPNDYILERSKIVYNRGENATSHDRVYICGEITEDHSYLDESFVSCKKFAEKL